MLAQAAEVFPQPRGDQRQHPGSLVIVIGAGSEHVTQAEPIRDFLWDASMGLVGGSFFSTEVFRAGTSHKEDASQQRQHIQQIRKFPLNLELPSIPMNAEYQ